MSSITPFKVTVSDEAIQDLHRRIDQTRWFDAFGDPDWTFGADVGYMRALVDYWRNGFSWRAAEAQLNSFAQHQLEIDGLALHFIHEPSPHPGAAPLIMTHGWPGSVAEFLEAIPRLTRPELYGGSPADAFHVVCPSLPGYGFSAAPQRPGMHLGPIAERHAKLMTALGYDRYLAQGGDWGAMVTQLTAACDADHCQAIHLNLLAPEPPADIADPMSLVREHEQAWLSGIARHQREGAGYAAIQSTRPNSLGFGLTDSPVGLCAWIAEKFHCWCDCEREGTRDIRNAVSWDALLTNVSLYWFSNSIAASMRLYKEYRDALGSHELTMPKVLPTPFGVTVYPGEIHKSPKAWAERKGRLIHWSEPAQGGHFAAMEQPQVFAEELRAFARKVRQDAAARA